MENNKLFSEEIAKMVSLEAMLTFRDETVRIFRENDLKQGKQFGEYEKLTYWEWWIYLPGTGGMRLALEKAFQQHNLLELSDYYNGLNWIQKDIFDEEICQELMRSGLVKEA